MKTILIKETDVKDLPISFLVDCPVTVKTWLINQNIPYANLSKFEEFLLDIPNFGGTKPQLKGLIRFLSKMKRGSIVTKMRYDNNNKREEFLALKYKLKQL